MTLLMSVAGDRAAQGFSILQQIMAIAGLYSIARYLSGPVPAAFCTLGFATVPPAVYFSGCGYVEPALIMTLTSSVLLWIHVFHEDALTGEIKLPAPPKIFLLGLIAGWLPAIKYTGLIYTGIIIFMILWPYRKTPFKKIYHLICMFILGTTPGFCWMIWNWMTFGNPVYPFAGSIFGGLGWSDETSRAMSIYMDLFGMGKRWLDYILIPWRLAFSGKLDTVYFDGAMGLFLLCVHPFRNHDFLDKIRNGSKKNHCSIYGVCHNYVRCFLYLEVPSKPDSRLPTQMLTCLCAAPSVHYLIGRIRGKKIIETLCAFLLVASLAWNYYYLFHRWNEIGLYKPILGLESESSFLKRIVPGYPMMDYINRNLPDSSRIYSIWIDIYDSFCDPFSFMLAGDACGFSFFEAKSSSILDIAVLCEGSKWWR